MPFGVMLIVLFSAMLHATWNSLVKAGANRYLDTAGILVGSAAIALVFLPFLPHPERASWPYLAASGLIHVGYFALVAAAYNYGEMSVVYPIMRGTAPVLTAIGSAVILHESPSPIGWVGAALVSAGVITFAFEKRIKSAGYLVPVVMALVNAVIIALYTVVDGAGVRISKHALSYTCVGFVLCAIGYVPIAAFLNRKHVAAHIRKQWARGLIGGACSIAAYSLALWAMTRVKIASVAALRETAILFGVLIAGYKLKEQVTPTRIVACLLVVAGAVAIKMK